MNTILVSTFTNEAASKTKGKILRAELEKYITAKEDVSVDFSGIDYFASPFFNTSFGSLAISFGFDTIEKIQLLNIADVGRDTYDTSIDNAKLISSKPEFTEEISKIINNTPKKAD